MSARVGLAGVPAAAPRARLVVFAALLARCATATAPTAAPDGARGDAPGPAPTDAAPWTRPPMPGPAPVEVGAGAPPVLFSLPNGMTVMVIERHRRPIVSLRLVFAAGAAQEPPIRAGATNLAYALLAELYEVDETGKRLIGEKSLRRQVVDAGGQYRSAVGHDHASIGIDGYATDLDKYLGLLAGGVARPRAGERVFEQYRRGMLDGLEELEVSDAEVVEQAIAQASFGAQHPYARPIMGTAKSLEDLSLDEVRAEQKRQIVPSRATLVVVGDVSPPKVARLALEAFAAWTSRTSAPPATPVVPPEVTPRRAVQLLTRVPASTTMVCATRALGDVPLDDAAADVLAHVLGDGVTSRIAVLREKHGWSYSPGALLIRRKYGRSLLMCARLDAAATADGVRVLAAALADVRANGLTADEVAQARAVLKARALAGGDEVGGALGRAIEKIVFGSTAEDRAQKLDAVTVEHVREVAAKVLDPARIQWLMLGRPSDARRAVGANALGPVNTARMADLAR